VLALCLEPRRVLRQVVADDLLHRLPRILLHGRGLGKELCTSLKRLVSGPHLAARGTAETAAAARSQACRRHGATRPVSWTGAFSLRARATERSASRQSARLVPARRQNLPLRRGDGLRVADRAPLGAHTKPRAPASTTGRPAAHRQAKRTCSFQAKKW
jgi:hypothetical protein